MCVEEGGEGVKGVGGEGVKGVGGEGERIGCKGC